MKISKLKQTALILTVMLILSAFPLYGFIGINPPDAFSILASAETGTDTADDETVYIHTNIVRDTTAETVAVEFAIQNAEGVTSLDLDFSYDADKLTYQYGGIGSSALAANIEGNSFYVDTSTSTAGTITLSASSLEHIMSTEEYANAGATVDSDNFILYTCTFSADSETELSDSDFSYTSATANIGGTKIYLTQIMDYSDNSGEAELPTDFISYASLEPTVTDDGTQVFVTMYLNNCVGLTSADTFINYDSDKYEFLYFETGLDANAVKSVPEYLAADTTADVAGELNAAFYFDHAIKTSEEYLAANSEAIVNDEHFAVLSLCFDIIANVSEEDMANDFYFYSAQAQFTDGGGKRDIGIVPPYITGYASAAVSRDRTTDTAALTLILNNCIDLTSLDAELTYNSDKLTFTDLTYGEDTQQLNNASLDEVNQYSHVYGSGENPGSLIYNASFSGRLWDSTTASNYNVEFNGETCKVATFNFTIADNVELTPEDFGFSAVNGSYDKTKRNLNRNSSVVELLCEHIASISTCVKQGICTVCGDVVNDYAPHVGGTATCTQYAECETCGQPYGELASHTGGTATATSSAVCEVCLEEYGNFAPVEPIDISGTYENGNYCLYLYFRNAIGLVSADLQLSFDTEQLYYISDNYGADAIQLSNVKDAVLSYDLSESTPGQLVLGMFFKSQLETSEEYAAQAKQGTEVNINSDNFEVLCIYFGMSDSATASQEKATVTLTGTYKYAAESFDCADSLFFKAEEHVCHGGRATCQELAICPDCGNIYGDYAWHVDGDFDGFCDICLYDMQGISFTYELIKGGCLIITGYTGKASNVSIPEQISGITVSSIGDEAFNGCESIESISIPQNIASVGERAFTDCINLKAIEVDDKNPKFSAADGVLFNKNKTKLICRPQAKPETSYIIPSGVTSIGDDALRNCIALTSVTLPEGLTEIGFYAFYNCENLSAVSIPMGVKNIDAFSFASCTNLKNATLAQGVNNIGEFTFYNCSSLEALSLPDSLASINGYAFKDCTKLASIELPDSLTDIGIGAFSNTAYYNNTKNHTNGVLYINKYLIEAAPDIVATDYTVLSGTTLLADNSFANCDKLTKVTIPAGVSIIGDEAFMNCSSLKSVTLPDSISSFGSRVFKGASSELVLHGTNGSSTQEYATNNGISFEGLKTEHVHTYNVDVVKPTCTASGYTEYTCTSCDYKYTDKVTGALGHNPGEWEIVASIRVKLCTRCSLLLQSEKATVTIDTAKSNAWISGEDKTLRGVSDNTTVADLRNMLVDPASIEIRDLADKVIDKSDTETLLGTGFKISRISSDGKQLDSVTAIIMGDLDGDGTVSAADARLALRQSVKLEQLGNAFLISADINGDGVAAADARLILRYSVKLETTLIGIV